MQIREITKSLFTSSEVDTLATNISEEISQFSPGNPSITALNEGLKSALADLKQSRGNSRHNTQTDEVVEADQVRDMGFRAFYKLIEACVLRQNEETQQHAKTVMTHLEKVDRNLPNLGYSEESRELELFFQEMDKVPDELEALGAKEWVDEIKVAEEEFIMKRQAKSDEDMEKKALIPTKQARETTVAHLNALCNLLNSFAMARMEGMTDLNTKIDQIVSEVETPARARVSRRNKKEEL